MNNFFFKMYNKFKEMGGSGKDLDSMLDALPWKEIEHKSDGTIIYECEIKDE